MGRIIDRIILLFIVYSLMSIVKGPEVRANEATDYLILQSIGEYHNSGKGKCGQGSGIIAATGHFGKDHSDLTCRTGYYNKIQDIVISVQVTLHSGSDSDRWLLHEVERGYRSEDLESEYEGVIKEIDDNKIFTWLYGTSYRWVSNNIVVYISYSDPQLTKPEPLEVVRAYLVKYPSSITLTDAEVRTRAHNEQWLKDEMERRVWLSEKWIGWVKSKVQSPESIVRGLENVREHLEVFLKYREKYLGVKVSDKEMRSLDKAVEKKDIAGMEDKVKGYREWWNENKAKPLQNVPGN